MRMSTPRVYYRELFTVSLNEMLLDEYFKYPDTLYEKKKTNKGYGKYI